MKKVRTSILGKRVWSGRLEEDLRVRGALPEPREHAAEDARAVRRPLRQGRGREVQDLIAKLAKLTGVIESLQNFIF